MNVIIPFDHIKVLPDGNFGCTLILGENIYTAIYTPQWEVLKHMHKVTEDPFSDYTYKRDDTLKITPSCIDNLDDADKDILLSYNDEQDMIDEIGIEFDILIEEYILGKLLSEEENNDISKLYFIVQYLDRNGNIAFTLDNALATYSLIGLGSIKELFNRLSQYFFNKELTIEKLGINKDSTSPVQKAAIKLIDLAYSVKKNFDNLHKRCCLLDMWFDDALIKTTLLNYIFHAYNDEVQMMAYQKALFDFPQLAYMEYLKLTVPEVFNSDNLMF